jgi:uncharacterized protein YmfQ (DUF2313 family)
MALDQLPLDQHTRRSDADYASAFSALLPSGAAWPRGPSELQTVLLGLSQIWGASTAGTISVDGRAGDLLETEADPRATLELLPDWERAWGLPDPCVAEVQSISQRRATLVQRMTIEGQQSRAFFIEQAALIGYEVSITEYAPFQCGISACGDTRYTPGVGGQPAYYVPGINWDDPLTYRWHLGPPELRYYWTVHVLKMALTYFQAGSGQCGVNPLLYVGLATDLECLIRRWKPAHTDVIFDYTALAGEQDYSQPAQSGLFILGMV